MNYFRRSRPFCLHTIQTPQEKLAIQKTRSFENTFTPGFADIVRYQTVRDKKMAEFLRFSRKHIGIKDTYAAYVRVRNAGMNFADIEELLRKL